MHAFSKPRFQRLCLAVLAALAMPAMAQQASEQDPQKQDTVKTLDKQYMRAQIARAGTPGPRAIGIDEISIRKGHSHRIVVSDLDRRRAIWFGGLAPPPADAPAKTPDR